jgi:hypothetical protein
VAPFQPLIQRVRDTFPGKMWVLFKGDHIALLIPGLQMSGAIPLLVLPDNTPSQDFMTGTGTTLRYFQSVIGEGKKKEKSVDVFV